MWRVAGQTIVHIGIRIVRNVFSNKKRFLSPYHLTVLHRTESYIHYCIGKSIWMSKSTLPNKASVDFYAQCCSSFKKLRLLPILTRAGTRISSVTKAARKKLWRGKTVRTLLFFSLLHVFKPSDVGFSRQNIENKRCAKVAVSFLCTAKYHSERVKRIFFSIFR